MQADEIISGYADLFRQFKDRTHTETDIEKLNLLFYLEDQCLVAVENDGEHSMVLAIFDVNRKEWQHELEPGSTARRMVESYCENNLVENVSRVLSKALDRKP